LTSKTLLLTTICGASTVCYLTVALPVIEEATVELFVILW